MRQGDTGNVEFTGLPEDANYSVYMSIYNEDTNTIIAEQAATTYTQTGGEDKGKAVFTFDETFSNSLPVGDWNYGLKICANGTEDTLLPKTSLENGKLVKEPAPSFTVDNKIVEGD